MTIFLQGQIRRESLQRELIGSGNISNIVNDHVEKPDFLTFCACISLASMLELPFRRIFLPSNLAPRGGKTSALNFAAQSFPNFCPGLDFPSYPVVLASSARSCACCLGTFRIEV
jgi:hypothetical protein